jgi:P pilus assembly chaperone PapD
MTLSRTLRAAAVMAAVLTSVVAQAGITLSKAVIDIGPNDLTAQDIDIANDGKEVSYVTVEPSEIIAPGTPEERRVPITDPGVGGLLVTPQRLILQPGEHKLVRIAAIAARPQSDRIYRVIIKPVAGPVTATATALKMLVGYDVLVIYRPAKPAAQIVGERTGNILTLRNQGNSNAEVYEGKQCEGGKPSACTELPSRRLYPGQVWQQTLPNGGAVQYGITGAQTGTLQF